MAQTGTGKKGKTNLADGRAMAQVVSRWPLTVDVRVSPHGICGGQSSTGTVFSLSPLVFPSQYNSTMALHPHISRGE
jgi:hypothetical protein